MDALWLYPIAGRREFQMAIDHIDPEESPLMHINLPLKMTD